MIDIKALERNEPMANGKTYLENYRQCLIHRGFPDSELEAVLEINRKRKTLITEKETLRAKQNQQGEQIAKKKSAKEDASELLKEMQLLIAKAI